VKVELKKNIEYYASSSVKRKILDYDQL